MRRKLFIDLDGVCYDTIKRICELYNEDFQYYDGFERVRPSQVQTWDFDELRLADRSYIDKYFGQPRFFSTLKPFVSATIYINRLINEGHDVTFLSKGGAPNIRLKEKWVAEWFPECDLIGVPRSKEKRDCADLRGAILIDDEFRNLSNSNAAINICYGHTYPWNEEWCGLRCKDWTSAYNLIKEAERES